MLHKLFSKTTPETKAIIDGKVAPTFGLWTVWDHTRNLFLYHISITIWSICPNWINMTLSHRKINHWNRCLRVLFRIFWFQSPLQVPISTSPLQCSLQHQRNDLVALARPLSDLSENNGWTAGGISRICKVSLEYNTMGDMFLHFYTNNGANLYLSFRSNIIVWVIYVQIAQLYSSPKEKTYFGLCKSPRVIEI